MIRSSARQRLPEDRTTFISFSWSVPAVRFICRKADCLKVLKQQKKTARRPNWTVPMSEMTLSVTGLTRSTAGSTVRNSDIIRDCIYKIRLKKLHQKTSLTLFCSSSFSAFSLTHTLWSCEAAFCTVHPEAVPCIHMKQGNHSGSPDAPLYIYLFLPARHSINISHKIQIIQLPCFIPTLLTSQYAF